MASRRKGRRRRSGASFDWPSVARRLLRIAGIAVLAFVFVSIAITLPLRWLSPPATAFMIRSRIVEARSVPGYQFRYRWRDLSDIAPSAALAVIASEDQRFAEHTGIDLRAISQALSERADGGRSRGASTISQQVAKNLYLWPGRSMIRKGLEAYLTLLLELFLPKRRIIEIYLNVAEFGVGTYGAEAAARKFFGKAASELRPEESALMATVLPAPSRLLLDSPSDHMRERQSWILRQIRNLGGRAYLERILVGGAGDRPPT